MHVLTTLRMYLGLTQSLLAKAVDITPADISEIKNQEPYGYMDKYLKLSRYLEIPVDALIKNDFTMISESFFWRHKSRPYLPMPKSPDLQMGRQGEDFIFRREQERLRESYPALAELVLPCYKLQGASPGYDILSFDEQGKPIFLEVKTSVHDTNYFRLTPRELDVAKKLTKLGESYVICCINRWDTPEQTVEEIPFQEVLQTHQITPISFCCRPKLEIRMVSGLAYYRHLRKLRQAELAELLGIACSKLSVYEMNRRKAPVQVYIRASECLDASIEDLLRNYPSEQYREVGHG